tara:strand:+ start:6822 stop:7355 length:534 start_codon:yes stop_codon:yes gene_type:complete
MSRIGNKPVELNDVKVSEQDNLIVIEGKKGKLTIKQLSGINIKVVDSVLTVSRDNDQKETRANHGLLRSLIYNAVIGVTSGYLKNMFLQGIGYRVQKKGNNLEFSLGYSHPVLFKAPNGIEFNVEGQNKFTVSGIDNQIVGQVCAEIKRLRKKDSYKGKGIFFEGESIKKKQGKSVK